MKSSLITSNAAFFTPLALYCLVGCGAGKECSETPECTGETDTTTVTTETGETGETGSTATGPIVEQSIPWSNIIFITLDTLRRDRISESHMPNLSAILDEAIVLRSNRACSNWTFVSMGCLLTGRSSIEQSFVPMDITDYPDSAEMLPEILREQGFHTRMVGSHVLLSIGNLFQGFDQKLNLNPAHADEVTAAALNGLGDLEQHARWLYYLHFQDPHQPFSAPDSYVPNFSSLPFTGIDWRSTDLTSMLEPRWAVASSSEQDNIMTNVNAYYDGEVAFLDEHIGLLWQGLLTSEALNDTLVVFMTDHGEQLYEHGGFTHDVDIYTEETSNIVAFWANGLTPTEVLLPTTNEDVASTILNALGLDVPPQMTGSVLGTSESDRAVFSLTADEYFGISQSVELNSQRLIFHWNGVREIFNLVEDPTETNDLFGEDSALDETLFSLLLPQIMELDTIMPDHSPAGL